jgi:hypothetical protein
VNSAGSISDFLSISVVCFSKHVTRCKHKAKLYVSKQMVALLQTPPGSKIKNAMIPFQLIASIACTGWTIGLSPSAQAKGWLCALRPITKKKKRGKGEGLLRTCFVNLFHAYTCHRSAR